MELSNVFVSDPKLFAAMVEDGELLLSHESTLARCGLEVIDRADPYEVAVRSDTA